MRPTLRFVPGDSQRHLGLYRFFVVVVLSALVLGWSELYFPMHESMQADMVKLIGELTERRRHIRGYLSALPELAADVARLQQEVDLLASRFPAAFTNDLYLVVNTAANRLYLRRGELVLREVIVSTGSNETLASGARRWVFATPRGVRTVVRKKERPVWIKPDWAFLEVGESVPSWDSPLRLQRGVLGSHLLDLGGGVAIHGTDKEHLLGRSVTHGCIRVGSEDIQFLYDSVPLGTKVYIY